MSHCNSRLGLDSSGDDGDSPISDTDIMATSLAHIEYNPCLILYEIREPEMCCCTQSLEINSSCQDSTVANETGLFCDADT